MLTIYCRRTEADAAIHPLSVHARRHLATDRFFLEADLPADIAARDAVLLALMGSPDARQIDGLGGADPLTSKVGIVRAGQRSGVDLEFLFAQVSIKEARVDTTPNCGNMLAAVAPFGLETGLVKPTGEISTLRVLTRNTGTLSDIEVQTPGGMVEYAGSARIDGVPGTASPINISFLETAGSVCGSLLSDRKAHRPVRRRAGHVHRQRHARRHHGSRGSRGQRL